VVFFKRLNGAILGHGVGFSFLDAVRQRLSPSFPLVTTLFKPCRAVFETMQARLRLQTFGFPLVAAFLKESHQDALGTPVRFLV
jgi:hypothetical protein